MKYLVVLGDGMADRPLKELNNQTPLEIADTPKMDFIAREGRSGLLKTLPSRFSPGSDVANLNILSYDPEKHYPGGRGPLEALAQGIKLQGNEIVIRFNFITEKEGIMESYSAGDISTPEAQELVAELNEKWGKEEGIKFYPGESYRGVLVLKNPKKYSEKVICKPPHEIKKKSLLDNLSQPLSPNEAKSLQTAKLLNDFILSSKFILEKHPVNKKRIAEGKSPANMLWFWGPGKYIPLNEFKDKFNISGAIISGVTLLKGIGIALGLEVISVPGATSSFDTNYQGKADYALKALEKVDFIYLHIKAPDDLSHKRDVKRKIQAIEKIDSLIVGRLLKKLEGTDFKIAILPDHATSSSTGEHLLDPVPFAIYDGGEKDSVQTYSEKAAKLGSYGIKEGNEFMGLFLKNGQRN